MRRPEAGNAVAEEKKGSRWVRALRSIKCSETVKGKGREELGEEENLQTPRGLLLRVNSCSHLPFNANTNKGERTLYRGILTRDGHADIFADAHRCGYPRYPTYVGYCAILSDNAEVDADIRIRMAIPIMQIY